MFCAPSYSVMLPPTLPSFQVKNGKLSLFSWLKARIQCNISNKNDHLKNSRQGLLVLDYKVFVSYMDRWIISSV